MEWVFAFILFVGVGYITAIKLYWWIQILAIAGGIMWISRKTEGLEGVLYIIPLAFFIFGLLIGDIAWLINHGDSGVVSSTLNWLKP
jgi:hypothetical protein